jgi:alkylation response protein AidB-like acyl-CoA dehydrogenase
MDFSIPAEMAAEAERLRARLAGPMAAGWALGPERDVLPREFFSDLGREGWFGFEWRQERLYKRPALREALLAAELARVSPGAAVAALAHADLGLMGLHLYGSDELKQRYAPAAVAGQSVMCLGNTEGHAGSDVAAIALTARPARGGWLLNGVKAYVTNGAIADLALITAVSDPDAPRNRRLSMFLVDLRTAAVKRTKLSKQVWLPSDLTRLEFQDTFVPDDHMLGERRYGLPQVLDVFAHSRVPIAALTLGTAAGAFELAVRHALRRSVFGRRIADHQAKAFEIAEIHAAMEAAQLVLWKTCWLMDRGEAFRAQSSIAKYLAVEAARRAALWAADTFGAASVMRGHPIHRYPLDVWAASLGEGTQDIQKLIIFRELLKRYG